MRQDAALFDDLAAVLGRLLTLASVVDSRRLPDLRRELHSLKSLLAFSDPALESRAHELEAAAEAADAAFYSRLGDFLEAVANLVRSGQARPGMRGRGNDEASPGIPPLILDPLWLDSQAWVDLHEHPDHRLFALRIVLDPAEALPRARIFLIKRRLESRTVLIQSEVWYWEEGSPEWIDAIPDQAVPAVFLRALVRWEGSAASLEAVLDMDGLMRLQISEASAIRRPVALVPRVLGLDAALQRQQTLLQQRRGDTRVKPDLMAESSQSVQSRLEQWRQYACHQARRQERSLACIVVAECPRLPSQVLDQLSRVVIQLVRNAVRHGLGSPEARERAGKEAMGTITLLLWTGPGEWGLSLDDDGMGIDTLAVARLAGKGDGILSPAELKEVLGRDGASLSESADLHAGHGLGLSLVNAVLSRELSARWDIRTQKGVGTGIDCFVPRQVLAMHFLVLVWRGFRYAVPLAQVRDRVAIQRRHINGPGRQREYGIVLGGENAAVIEPWGRLGVDLEGLDSLWPSDRLELVLLGASDHITVACPCDTIEESESVLMPWNAESVYSRRLDTWLPLVEAP